MISREGPHSARVGAMKGKVAQDRFSVTLASKITASEYVGEKNICGGDRNKQ